MLQSGLVSITFRELSPAEIIALVGEAELTGIEWGGDVHVPHGDLEAARLVGQMTRDAGLAVAAYGSYYRVGLEAPVPFEVVLETALALEAPLIRVWAGRQGSAEADDAYRSQVVDDSRRIAELAAAEGVLVAYEYHNNTLTDTVESAVRLLEAVGHSNMRTYWQPVGSTTEARLTSLQAVLPWLTNVHVQQTSGGIREMLREGEADWPRYLEVVAGTTRDHYILIEFVKEDQRANLLEDARTLRGWLGALKTDPGLTTHST
jgi:sugar phosphate isomerase/epimerase